MLKTSDFGLPGNTIQRRNNTMKSLKSLILAVTLMAAPLLAQNGSYSSSSGLSNGRVDVQAFAQWSMTTITAVTAGSQTVTLAPCLFPSIGGAGSGFFPLATSVKFTILDGANTETLTPSAVTSPVISTVGSA